MTSDQTSTEANAVEALQALGCREYEANCFVSLTRLPSSGTAREISELTGIPRSRVYDAMDQLAEKGLVEVHFSTPKRYRAVPLSEALTWFRDRFDHQIEQFERSVEALSPVTPDSVETEATVWSLTGLEAILVRLNTLVQNDTDEVVVYLDSDDRFNTELLAIVAAGAECDVEVFVPAEDLQAFVTDTLGTDATVSVVALPLGEDRSDDRTPMPVTVVLADGSAALLRTGGREIDETAVVAEGKHNSVVRWLRVLFGS